MPIGENATGIWHTIGPQAQKNERPFNDRPFHNQLCPSA
jgi:hypothetical protein